MSSGTVSGEGGVQSHGKRKELQEEVGDSSDEIDAVYLQLNSNKIVVEEDYKSFCLL